MTEETSLSDIAKALYTINRHAKTAPDPKHLYSMKKEAISQLLNKKQAKKIGLHFSNHPKLSNQHSTLLVQVDEYYFHIPPTKQDFKDLDHLGSLDDNYRNPRAKMSLSKAKRVIYDYIGWDPPKMQGTRGTKKQYSSAYFTPSSLGKMEWPPRKTHR